MSFANHMNLLRPTLPFYLALAKYRLLNLNATTFELRMSILSAKVADARVEVPGRVMEFLAHKITGNVRELEGALNRLIGHAELVANFAPLRSEVARIAQRPGRGRENHRLFAEVRP